MEYRKDLYYPDKVTKWELVSKYVSPSKSQLPIQFSTDCEAVRTARLRVHIPREVYKL